MATGSERYRKHKVWETLELKLAALEAARYGDRVLEQRRGDIIEWLKEAGKTRLAAQPALYLSSLEDLSAVLNALELDENRFKQFVSPARQPQNPQGVWRLEEALRALPLPPPRQIGEKYAALLDEEIAVRTTRLSALEGRIAETEKALTQRLADLEVVGDRLDGLQAAIEDERKRIGQIGTDAQSEVDHAWAETLADWRRESDASSSEHNESALAHVATLAATAAAGNALAEHAAGNLSASDWKGRATRERRAAQWMRAAGVGAFVLAAAFGYYIVQEAISQAFDLTLGDGVLRSSVALIIAAFGGLLLRESGRHFREADTAEDVALSLTALAPFYAGASEAVRLDARSQIGDAVMVRNVLSRFAHRDAAKHASEVSTSELLETVNEAIKALRAGPGAGNG